MRCRCPSAGATSATGRPETGPQERELDASGAVLLSWPLQARREYPSSSTWWRSLLRPPEPALQRHRRPHHRLPCREKRSCDSGLWTRSCVRSLLASYVELLPFLGRVFFPCERINDDPPGRATNRRLRLPTAVSNIGWGKLSCVSNPTVFVTGTGVPVVVVTPHLARPSAKETSGFDFITHLIITQHIYLPTFEAMRARPKRRKTFVRLVGSSGGATVFQVVRGTPFVCGRNVFSSLCTKGKV